MELRISIESTNELLNEARRLSQLFRFLSPRMPNFAMISASKSEFSERENKKRYEQLKQDVRNLGYSQIGYVLLRGGWTYKEGGKNITIEEDSLLIPNIPKEEALDLCNKYEQKKILYKENINDDEFCLYLINPDGSEENRTCFDKDTPLSEIVDFSEEAVKEYFSALKKGSHRLRKAKDEEEDRRINRGRKFVFKLKEWIVYGNHIEAYARKGKANRWWIIIDDSIK